MVSVLEGSHCNYAPVYTRPLTMVCRAVNYIPSTHVVEGQLYGRGKFSIPVWSDEHYNSDTANTNVCWSRPHRPLSM